MIKKLAQTEMGGNAQVDRQYFCLGIYCRLSGGSQDGGQITAEWDLIDR